MLITTCGLALAILLPQEGIPSERLKPIRDYATVESETKPDLGGLDWKAIRDGLRAWKPDAPATGAEASRTHTLSNGHEATFYYYVPKSYDPAKPAALAFFLHGGVVAPQPKRGRGQWRAWKEEADGEGWIVCSPSGDDKCVWWEIPGEEHILEAVRILSARYAVDRNRVFVAGFSDGASGVYSLGMKRTDVWAACIPWNGAVGVLTAPQGGNTPFYTVNCRGTAWRATHGGKDQLYPASSQEPVIEQMKAGGVKIEWKNFEDFGHEGGRIIGGDREFIDRWLAKQKRDPLPEQVDWTTHDAAHHGQAYWIRISELGDRPGDSFAGEKDYTFPLGQAGPPRPVLGVQIDQTFQGEGVRVQAVSDGSGAKDAGVQEGDVIVEANGKAIGSFDDLRAVLSKAKGGDKVTLKISRDGKELELEVPFRPIEAKAAAIPPAGRVRATRKGNALDVLAKRVARFEILVSPEAFDLSKEIAVTVNGKELFRGVVKPDAQFMLDEFRRRYGDLSVTYVARIVIEIPSRREY